MSITVIIFILLIGLLLIMLEAFFIPGTGFAGILGLIVLGAGIWLSYEHLGNTAGHIILSLAFVLVVGASIITLRSSTWDRVALKKNIDSKVNEIDEELIHVGDQGVAISRLTPMGKAMFNDEYFEVRSQGEFVDENTRLEVIKIDGNRIYVKPIN